MHRKSIAPRSLAASPGPFRRKLLAWFDRSARDLPWRRTRDPYQVLVSEVMLQQTQVSRVEQYYSRFLEQFPDLGALASARPRAVREAWDGLGYYARARNLHALAKTVTRRSGTERSGTEIGVEGSGVAGKSVAKLPDDPEELIKLPGVGRYTAGAVASFAYEKPVPAVDTNVARVIRRVFFGERILPQRTSRQRLTPQRPIPLNSSGPPPPPSYPKTASAPGDSIRRSWSWGLCCVQHGSPNANSVQCNGCVGPERG